MTLRHKRSVRVEPPQPRTPPRKRFKRAVATKPKAKAPVVATTSEEEEEEDDDEAEIYEVEEILGRRGWGAGIEYLVKWKGYDEKSWEPKRHLNCDSLLDAFRQKTVNEPTTKGKKEYTPTRRTTKKAALAKEDGGKNDRGEEQVIAAEGDEAQDTVKAAAIDDKKPATKPAAATATATAAAPTAKATPTVILSPPRSLTTTKTDPSSKPTGPTIAGAAPNAASPKHKSLPIASILSSEC